MFTRPQSCLGMTRHHLFTFSLPQVHDHPGSYEDYGGRMAAAAPAIAKAALMGSSALPSALGQFHSPPSSPSTANSPTSSSGVLPPLTVVRSAVIRGCVQLVAWARGLRPGTAGAGDGLQDGGGGDAGSRDHELQQQQQHLRALVTSLPQLLPGGFGLATAVQGSGLDMGVSVQVQVGGAMTAAGPGAGRPSGSAVAGMCGGATEELCSSGGTGHGAAKLLQFSPAALAIPQAEGSVGDATVILRLPLHNPAPQPARVLVLADRGGREQVQQNEQQQRQHVPSQLLAEVPVELVAGSQEVDMALGVAEMAAAVEPAGDGAVGVLQLVLVGPEHNAAGEAAAEQFERPHAYPLVHWVAPPLLLLPPVAADELCRVWGAMQRAAGPEEGAEKQQTSDGGIAGIEHVSSLWWAHLAPLLGDLAYALGGKVQGDAAAMKAVSAHLLPYLDDNGLPETAAMVQQQLVGRQPVSAAVCATEGDSTHAGIDTHTAAADQVCCIASSTGAVSPSKDTEQDSTSNPKAALQLKLLAAAVTPTSSDCSSSTCCADPPTDNDPALPTANDLHSGSALQAAPGSSRSRSLLSALLAPVRYLLPPAPFSPPALELSYQAWRLASMAAAAPYVLLLTAQPMVLVVVRMAREQGSVELLQAALLALLGWITDACSSLALLCMRGGIASNPHASAAAATVTASVVRQHYLAAVLYSPAVLLLASALIALRVVPFHAPYVGSVRLVLMCTAHRSVVLPSIRQLSVREKWGEGPLLVIGEALHVCFMQPQWGWPAVLMTVLVWRLIAVLTAAVWERRSRRRFAVLRQ